VTINVLVTRPAGQAEGLCAQLQRDGYESFHVPVMRIERLTGETGSVAERPLSEYRGVVIVSLNAAMCFLEQLNSPHKPERPPLYTVGKTTASWLAKNGFECRYPEQQMDSEGLLALEALSRENVEGTVWLIARGMGGRTLIADTLTARGAEVEQIELYRREVPMECAGELLEALQNADVVTVNSAESFDNMLAMLAKAGTDLKNSSLANKPVVVPGKRVASELAQAGCSQVHVAANATDDAVMQAIRQVLSA
jgi:uroporphyrinogen-III synthase